MWWFFNKNKINNATVNVSEKTLLLPSAVDDLEANLSSIQQKNSLKENLSVANNQKATKKTAYQKKIDELDHIIQQKRSIFKNDLENRKKKYDEQINKIKKTPFFIGNHPKMSFVFAAGTALLGGAAGLFYKAAVVKSSTYSDQEIYDIVSNTTISGFNMTCGEVMTPSISCNVELHSNFTNCNKEYNDLCEESDISGFVIGGVMAGAAGATSIVLALIFMKILEISFRARFKDLSNADYQAVHNLLEGTPSYTNINRDSLLKDVIAALEKEQGTWEETFQNEIKQYEEKKAKLTAMMMTYQRKISFFYPKDSNKPDMWRGLPRDVVKEIFHYINPEIDYAEITANSISLKNN